MLVLPRKHPEQCLKFVSWLEGVVSLGQIDRRPAPALLCLADLLCTAPTHATQSASKFLIPGHALHERDLQGQIGICLLVSSQDWSRPVDTPQIKRGSNAGFVPPSVYIGFPWLVLPKTQPGCHYSIAWRVRGAASPGRTVPSASCAARPRPALPSRRDFLYRHIRGMSVFGARQV